MLVGLLIGLLVVGFAVRLSTADKPDDDGATGSKMAKRAGPGPARARPEQPEAQRLSVGVVDGTGQPIVGAQVCLLLTGREVLAQRCAATDAGGFVDDLEVSAGERWRIAVSAEGYRPAMVPRPGELAPRGDHVQVTLRRGGVRVTGVVEDATGGTIEGALVRVEDASGAAMAASVSRAGGEFELWASEGHARIEAAADGYVSASERLVVPSGPVQLVLLPEAVIAGRVLDAQTGAAIPDALVSARRTDNDAREGSDDGVYRARSDEQGRYEIRGLPGGVFGLSSHGPWGEGASEGGVTVEFSSRTEGVDILIHRGTTVRARVVIAETQHGCPGAEVSLVEEDVGRRLASSADLDGRVELSVAGAGSYRVAVRCEGHRLVGDSPVLQLSGNPSDDESIELMVERGFVLRGRVSGDGEPIAEASVALIAARGGPPAAVAVANSAGKVELSGLDDGEYVVTGVAPGWFPVDAQLRVTIPRDDSFELALRAGGSLRGGVVEVGGRPVPSARVLAVRRSVNGRWRGETLTDAEGHFAFASLPPGSYQVDVLAEGGQPLTTSSGAAASASASVEGGEASELEFVVVPQTGVITGVVVDGDGEPLTAAFVCAKPDVLPPDAVVSRGRCAPRMTDVDGSFEIRRLSGGQFTLEARVRGGGEAVLSGVAIGDDVELVVRDTGSLQGSAHYRSGASIPDLLVVEVVRTDAAVRRRDVFLRTRGEWSIAGLPVGRYQVRIKASQGAGAVEAEVGAGRNDAGDVPLDDLTQLIGRVVRLETGEPLADFRVVATALDAQLRSRYVHEDARNVSDTSGRFLISDPPTGRVTLHVIPKNLHARPPDLTEAHLSVTVNPGAPLDLGDVGVPTRRLSPDQRAASFGFRLVRWDHVADQADQVARVISVEPGGAAAAAGLEVGDVITAIDGYDVVGRRYILQYLLAAPVGTSVALDTERAPGLVLVGS
ncbi:Nickel uptake substrate-specific transmembrane region [Enhygromyxa salina]|uniref:Nickel uptake substrate-specific transmembrane region n=1 Tax=Enhygromyxa salina TaxID=215803 RepID=A0A2S9XU30_9BACT|nr:Nickel uptake substrate-specific transmembrane region [Enhygromyxa salina]